jgi:hypothetical protein
MVAAMTTSGFAQSFGRHRRPWTGAPGSALAWLAGFAVALGAAFVLAPAVLASSAPGGGYAGQPALITAVRTTFIEYWNSGRRAYPPDLARLLDYWTRYHIAKAAIAALLLAVLVILAARLWRALLSAARLTPVRGAALALSGALAAVLAVGSAVLVVANIQGAVTPLSSLLSMLPLGSPDTQLSHAVGQVKQGLAAYPGTGRTAPALQVMVNDFGLYHAVVVGLAAAVTVIAIVMSAVSWRRRARSSERRTRRVLELAGVSSALLALVVLVIALANLGTALHPAPALLAFFNAGPGGL